MNERTFRAVVASVLVVALALAIIVVAANYLPKTSTPLPSESASTAAPGPTATAVPTSPPGPAFQVPLVVGVGDVARGTSSDKTLVLRFLESRIDAIPAALGSFTVTLADHAGDGSTVAFVGTPSVDAPGSLGATASLTGPNVLMINIVASDNLNVEQITITGLGMKVASTAAIGATTLELGGFAGSLASGAASNVLASPGSVVAGP